MPLARLSRKSQFVIPARIRRSLGIQPGDLLEIVEQEDHVVIRKAPASFVDALDRCASSAWEGYATRLHEERDAWAG